MMDTSKKFCDGKEAIHTQLSGLVRSGSRERKGTKNNGMEEGKKN